MYYAIGASLRRESTDSLMIIIRLARLFHTSVKSFKCMHHAKNSGNKKFPQPYYIKDTSTNMRNPFHILRQRGYA